VYSRELDGDTLTFAASGWTYNFTFVLADHQTESLWYHLEGTEGLTCISGFYADRFLPEAGAVLTRWNNWFSEHPETKYWKAALAP